MSATESRSIRTAALALLVLSALRWGVARRPHVVVDQAAGRPGAPATALDELAVATERVLSEAARRARPMVAGERIDPNRADETELDRLPGVGPSTAAAITRARDSGMVFRRADDLLVVRGIGPGLVARLTTLLDFSERAPLRAGPREAGRSDRRLVDLNQADRATLQRLPGIGPALADRIVLSRRDRPFASVDDLVRVPGIGPKTVERLRAAATAGATR